jgi:hypothetical protein
MNMTQVHGVAEALSGSEGLSAVLSVATANAAEMAAPTRRRPNPQHGRAVRPGRRAGFRLLITSNFVSGRPSLFFIGIEL